MKTNIFLAALPSHDTRLTLTQKISACEAKRSPLAKVQWTHTQDLHVTLGFIEGVNEIDLRGIALSLTSVGQTASFMSTVEDIKLFGNTIVLKLQPYPVFLSIHKKMNQILLTQTQNQYHFDDKKRYDPHITIGRIKNLPALNQLHKQQLISLCQEQFRSTSFLIQQAALLRRRAENSIPAYQTLQLYTLKR